MYHWEEEREKRGREKREGDEGGRETREGGGQGREGKLVRHRSSVISTTGGVGGGGRNCNEDFTHSSVPELMETKMIGHLRDTQSIW